MENKNITEKIEEISPHVICNEEEIRLTNKKKKIEIWNCDGMSDIDIESRSKIINKIK